MLTEVTLRDFKAIADATLPLQRLTVLVGANGAGKSSALAGIEMAVQLSQSFDVAMFRYFELDPVKWTRRGHPHFGIKPTFAHTQGQTIATFTRGLGSDLPHAQLSFRHRDGRVVRRRFDFNKSPDPTALADVHFGHNLTVRHFQLSVPKLREASAATSPTPSMDQDGQGLASTLAHLLKADRDAFDALERDLKQVVPQVRRVALEPRELPGKTTFGDVVAVDIHDVGRILAPDLSEGTLLTLALLTELHRPKAPDILLLDDIDRGLHPRAQADLIACLRRLLQERPTLQIVATSHSPYLLDHLEPSEVIVMALDEPSRAHARCLAEHPEWPRMKDLLQTGEFWASVGEAWVIPEALPPSPPPEHPREDPSENPRPPLPPPEQRRKAALAAGGGPNLGLDPLEQRRDGGLLRGDVGGLVSGRG